MLMRNSLKVRTADEKLYRLKTLKELRMPYGKPIKSVHSMEDKIIWKSQGEWSGIP